MDSKSQERNNAWFLIKIDVDDLAKGEDIKYILSKCGTAYALSQNSYIFNNYFKIPLHSFDSFLKENFYIEDNKIQICAVDIKEVTPPFEKGKALELNGSQIYSKNKNFLDSQIGSFMRENIL